MIARFFLGMFCCCTLATTEAQTANWTNKADAWLLQQWQQAKPEGFWVEIAARPSFQDMPKGLSKPEKTRYVFEHLQRHADESQADIRRYLIQQSIDFQSYWMVNALYIPQGNLALAQAIAQRGDVARLLPNLPIRAEFPRPEDPLVALRDGAPEWGLTRIQADSVWALGFRGQGAVIGGQDTGYDWEHPALQSKYRGWDGSQASHDYHWHDAIHEKHPLNVDTFNPCGFNVPHPCDDGSHGTHTMGTMVGGVDNEIIGVAPEARWIGCRNMERGWGTPESYIECFQWFMAPTDLNGQNPNPDMAPHVINNSWGCPTVEGCNPNNFELMRQAVANLRLAGVVVVVSAGNDGPACHTVKNPAPIFAESFSIGASTPADTVAAFSSRGNVTVDGSNRLKPNVVAPGTQVRSSVPGGGYASYQGTSMAGPHVAGLVALLISADPNLAGQVERIEEIIEQTAVPIAVTQSCDGFSPHAIPNPISGYGRVDVLAALRIVRPDLFTENPMDTASLRIYPNPAQSEVMLIAPMDMNDATIRVYNTLGQLMFEKTVYFKRLQQLDISSLPNGVYMVTLESIGNKKRKNRLTAKLEKMP